MSHIISVHQLSCSSHLPLTLTPGQSQPVHLPSSSALGQTGFRNVGFLFKWSFPLTSPSCLWPVLLSTAWRLNLLPNPERTLWASASTYAPNFWHLCMPRAMYISWLALGRVYLLPTSTERARSAAAEEWGTSFCRMTLIFSRLWRGGAGWEGGGAGNGMPLLWIWTSTCPLTPPSPWLRYQNTEPSASYFGAIAGSAGLISYT